MSETIQVWSKGRLSQFETPRGNHVVRGAFSLENTYVHARRIWLLFGATPEYYRVQEDERDIADLVVLDGNFVGLS